MIRSVIINLLISLPKTATIPTYQGISIAFLRYIAMQHPPSHDLIFMSYMFLLHSTWTLIGHLLARKHREHRPTHPKHYLQIWHDTPGQYIECTCKLTTTNAPRQNNNMASRLKY